MSPRFQLVRLLFVPRCLIALVPEFTFASRHRRTLLGFNHYVVRSVPFVLYMSDDFGMSVPGTASISGWVGVRSRRSCLSSSDFPKWQDEWFVLMSDPLTSSLHFTSLHFTSLPPLCLHPLPRLFQFDPPLPCAFSSSFPFFLTCCNNCQGLLQQLFCLTSSTIVENLSTPNSLTFHIHSV
jgi:hypothetical protein